MTRFLAFLSLLTAFCIVLAIAELPAYAATEQEKLQAVQEQLEARKKEADRTAQNKKGVEAEIEKTRARLVELSQSVQDNEGELQTLEKDMAGLSVQKTELFSRIQEGRAQTAKLLLALERIRRVPPEAIIAMPGAPLKTAQSAMLLQTIIPAIHKQAASLKSDLENMDIVTGEIEDKRKTALRTQEALKGEQEKVALLVAEREKLNRSLGDDLKKQQDDVKKISRQAKDLQDLIARLEDERKRAEQEEAEQAKKEKTRTASAKKKRPALPRPGNLRLPVPGEVVVGYKEKDVFGAPSQGISIAGRPGGLVVSPMGGVVMFSGPFKGYGNLIIVEHKDGYHSLIAGLEKIDTVVGQSVSAGEPLGLLGKPDGGGNPKLYFELRKNGHPVDPAVKLANLG